MSERPHFMQLEPDEDATSVRDRLTFVRGQRVLLVWPEDGTVLSRRLDLVLVQREAMRRAIRLALVTHDPDVIQYAAELNISTFRTIGESERKRWKRGRSKVFANRHQKPKDEPAPEALQDVASRVKADGDPNVTFAGAITRGIVLVALVTAVAGLFYIVFPSAIVNLTPTRTNETVSVTVTAAEGVSDIDIENRIVPMTQLRVEVVENGTIEATGAITLSDSRAAGTVVFINQTAGAVEIPAGTVVSTSAGTPIRFRTTEALNVPGGENAQAEVPIEALQDYAGPVGNVEQGLVNTVVGDLAGSVEVRNITPTSGGERQTATVITQADLDRLETTVRQQIQAIAFEEMQPLLSDTQFIILETLAITEERDDLKTFSGTVGDLAETVSLNMRAVVEATAVDEQSGRQIAFAGLSSQVPRGRAIQPNSITYTRGVASPPGPDGSIVFEMSASAIVAEPVNVGQLQRQLANRTPQQALTYLLNEIDINPGTVPGVRLSPSWMRRMPVLPARIRIQLEEAPL